MFYITARDVVIDFVAPIDLGDGNGEVASFTATTTFHPATEDNGEYYTSDGVNFDLSDGGMHIAFGGGAATSAVFVPLSQIERITS